MANSLDAAHIDWSPPSGPPDWLMGSGATRAERALVWAATGAAVVALLTAAAVQGVGWDWWQWLLVLVLTVDIAGGVTANSLATAKRFYHSPVPPGLPLVQRWLRHHVGFAALHLHAFVLAAAMPGGTVAWAAFWYAVPLAGCAAVARVPLYLRRPVAAGVVTTALIAAPAVEAPAGLSWLGPVLVLKLVVAHAVREEPYRPVL